MIWLVSNCMYHKMAPNFVLCSIYLSVLIVNITVAAVLSESETNSISRGLDAKGMLQSLASNFLPRGYFPSATGGGSQVVSLNLTNLLVLVLLKALIFAAGSIGAGTWKGGFMGRSNDGDDKLITEEEILLFLSYLTGSPGDNGCLQNIACQQPMQAKKYVKAADLLLKASKMLLLQPSSNYQLVLKELELAVDTGDNGGSCDVYVCNVEDNFGQS